MIETEIWYHIEVSPTTSVAASSLIVEANDWARYGNDTYDTKIAAIQKTQSLRKGLGFKYRVCRVTTTTESLEPVYG